MSIQFFGMPVSRGVAIGRAVLVASSRVDVAHYFIAREHVEDEVDRLRHARDTVAAELSALQRDLPDDAPAELSALLDVHLMLLHDETLTGAAKHWIVDRHYNAEWALSAQLEVLARQFDEMEDDYLRERKADLEQVVERMLRAMSRDPAAADHAEHAGTLGRARLCRRRPAGAGGQRRGAGGHDAASSAASSPASSPMSAGARRTRPSWRAAWTFRRWSGHARPAA